MKLRHLFCGLLIVSRAALFAQVPGPLKNLTSQYELQRATLQSTFEAQIKDPRARYQTALSAAQKAAQAASRTTDLAAIVSEMEAATAGALPETAPPDLPRALLPERRALALALANANRTIVPRQRELALAYQRSLAALEQTARKSGDQALIDAVIAEKQRAQTEVENAGGGAKNRNVVENGDFSSAPADGIPPGWTQAKGWKDVADAAVVSDGREKFLRFRRLQAINQSNVKPAKPIPIPAKARSAEVVFRMRVEGLVKGKEYDPWPGVHLSAQDGRDESIGKVEAVLKDNSSSWKRMTARLPIPDGAKMLNVTVGPFGAAGIVDFDDIVVEFK